MYKLFSLFTFCIAFASSAETFLRGSTLNILNIENDWSRFTLFLERFEKKYDSLKEFEERFTIFKENVKNIIEHNENIIENKKDIIENKKDIIENKKEILLNDYITNKVINKK